MCAAVNQIPPASALSSDGSGKVQLTVTTGDMAAEIFVVDGELELCARDIGKLYTELRPGIYKVKVRTGLSTQEDYVVLRDAPVARTFLPLSFSTPVPLVNTAKSHEYHQQAAVDQSQKIDVNAGQGSSIFVFARDWTAKELSATPRPWANPASGLKLKSMDGTVIVDIEQKATTSQTLDPDPTHDPWAACTIAVNPGAYRLSVETPDGELDQTVVAPLNWHVHVFLLQRWIGADQKQKGPDLAGAAIMLSQTPQFTPNGDEARLVELARLGLTEQRKVLSVELRQMMTLKFNDPMLGIFAGHLLLLDPSPDLSLLAIVVSNLRMIMPYSHPDVEALALRLAGTSVFQVSVPPMLRRSWSIILDASADQKATVVRGSAAADIIGRVSSVDPWLIWAQPASAQADSAEQQSHDSVFQQVLDDHLAQVVRSADDSWQTGKGFGQMGSVQSYASSVIVPDSRSVTEPQVKQLVHALGVPRFYLEDLLKNSGFTFPEK